MPPAELSATDHAIIEILQREGRTTYADIGSRVGVSATAAHERIKKLEARGVIRGYQAEIDPALVGAGVTAFIFVSQKAGPRGLVEELFADMPWVQECHHVAGEETLLLKVRAESMPALEHLVWEIRALDSVERTRTVVVLATVFENRPVAAATVDARGSSGLQHPGTRRHALVGNAGARRGCCVTHVRRGRTVPATRS